MAHKNRLPRLPGHYASLALEGPLAPLAHRIQEEARRAARGDSSAELNEAVKAYNAARTEMLKHAWKRARMTWCTKGRHVRPGREIALRYVDSRRIGGTTDCMSHKEWFDFYRSLHAMCTGCAKATETPEHMEQNYHGETDTVYTHVYPAREHRGGWQYRHEGKWLPVPERTSPVPKFEFESGQLGEERVAELEDAWGLPPEIEYRWYSGRAPVVYVRRDESVLITCEEVA